MRFYGKAECAATRILEAFKSGGIPKRLATVFVQRNDDIPCRKWSWNNQLLVALFGHDDARGFRQWQDVGRAVRKGEKSFPILVPLARKLTERDDDGTERERMALYGFKSAAVFGRDQTEVVDAELWAQHSELDQAAQRFIDGLPLLEVAKSWGISVQTFSGKGSRYLGFYRQDGAIALGVENLLVWAHELIHAADHRVRGELKGGQDVSQEIVAQLGGAVLLEALGYRVDSDRGFVWEYVCGYAKRAGRDPIAACQKLLKRTCEAVAKVLDTAAELHSGKGVAA